MFSIMILLAWRVSPFRDIYSKPPWQSLLLGLGCGSDGAELLVHCIPTIGSLNGDRCTPGYHTTIPRNIKEISDILKIVYYCSIPNFMWEKMNNTFFFLVNNVSCKKIKMHTCAPTSPVACLQNLVIVHIPGHSPERHYPANDCHGCHCHQLWSPEGPAACHQHQRRCSVTQLAATGIKTFSTLP